MRAWDMVDPQALPAKVEALYHYTQEILSQIAGSPGVEDFLATQRTWLDPRRITEKLIEVGQRLAPCILPAEVAEAHLRQCLGTGHVVLEGAQGTLLDVEVGTAPHVTQSITRCSAATQLLQPYLSQVKTTYIGISRPYAHRHGAGPLPTETPELEPYLRDRHNLENPWQGGLRVGWFDTFLARYARQVNPELDYLVLTNLDRLAACQSLSISPGYTTDRHPQETLTNYLFRAQPVYETVALKEVPAKVAAAYQTPLLAISAGEENAWTEVRPLDIAR
jgi:adenylosuccinate synthase